jgi:hypothetical protein
MFISLACYIYALIYVTQTIFQFSSILPKHKPSYIILCCFLVFQVIIYSLPLDAKLTEGKSQF